MFASLAANRMRAGLTILGVAIGVAAVVVLVALGQGASVAVGSVLEGLGRNTVFVTPGERAAGYAQTAGGLSAAITYQDAQALARSPALPPGTLVGPEQQEWVHVVAAGRNTTPLLIGVDEHLEQVQGWVVAEGRFLTRDDAITAAPVAVLGATAARNLFGTDSAVNRFVDVRVAQDGQTLTVRLKVIGVLEPKGTVAGVYDRDDVVFAPIETTRRRILGSDQLTVIILSAPTAGDMPAVATAATDILRARHHLAPNARAAFTVQTQRDLESAINTTSDIFTVLLAGIASISLLVGGIGIMNIMLVSVTERTREIGLRRAVGARRRDILFQFLGEAVVLTVLGGGAGVLAGFVIAGLVSSVSPISAAVSIPVVLLALGVSAGVGLVFGLYPARRASLLQPIAALRAE